jgi:hypothetical protein
MNQHLTEQQILECVAGTATAGSRLHVEQCAGCGAEVERLESAVRGFAGAALQAAGRPAPHLDWAAAGRSQAGLTWVPAWVPAWRPAVATLALLLLATPLMFHFRSYPKDVDNKIYTTSHSQQQQLERERADTALLEQVDAAVSRPVPQPIEPLVQLVAWGSKTNSGVTE